jgi:hypothetical protein
MKAHCLNAARASFPRKWQSILMVIARAKMDCRFRGNDEPKTSKAKANA